MSPTEPSKNATDRAYASLKSMIMNAELAPNESLLEGQLSERLGMSRTPVREACVRLQSEGLVEIVPRRGVRVVPISAADMSSVYDLLATLESRAAELAAERGATDDELAVLDDAVRRMGNALDADDLDAWASADFDFHRALVESSGNRHLAATAMQFADLVHRARLVTLRLRPTPRGSVEDHAELVDVIRAGDAAQAHQLHLTHRRAAAAELMQLLDYHRLRTL